MNVAVDTRTLLDVPYVKQSCADGIVCHEHRDAAAVCAAYRNAFQLGLLVQVQSLYCGPVCGGIQNFKSQHFYHGI